MTFSFVFPGQGSQKIGMGKELYDNSLIARDVFHEVEEALGYSLTDLMFNGEAETLNLTEHTQPALMAVSVATVKVLEHAASRDISQMATYLSGHSLGEYSALCVGGVLGVGETAKLLQLRGQSMQKAVPVGVGAMGAVLSLSLIHI